MVLQGPARSYTRSCEVLRKVLQGPTRSYRVRPGPVRRNLPQLPPLAPRPPDRKLYVRRISDLRAVSNAEEVEQLARDAGYQVVQPELLNFLEQVELFSRASHIMGPTGAWAANLLFAPQNARIDIFCPEPSRTDRNIWVGLGEPLGMQVDITYCPVTKSHYFPVHSDYSIPLETLKALLRQPAR